LDARRHEDAGAGGEVLSRSAVTLDETRHE
jgi:hypothetical protein